MKIPRALICGVSGQDGAYLSKFLLGKGYEVYGTSRDALGSNFQNLKKLGVFDRVTILSMSSEDFRSVFSILNKVVPDEVYFLSGQSSVGLSFELPVETMQSTAFGALTMLEACRIVSFKPRLYFAGSSEIFGDTPDTGANEAMSLKPRSPYAVAKASAYWLVDNYREAYGLFAATGILFNHESNFRPDRFVTQKIIKAVKNIANGSQEKLRLGGLDISRDWGWAPEYVEAMWLMLQQDIAQDFVIATGQKNSIQDFVELAFSYLNLDWREYVISDDEFTRPTDINVSVGNPLKAKNLLGWEAKSKMSDVVKMMLNDRF